MSGLLTGDQAVVVEFADQPPGVPLIGQALHHGHRLGELGLGARHLPDQAVQHVHVVPDHLLELTHNRSFHV